MDLFEEFKALIHALRDNQIDYAVVGALAVAVYGAPRATTDFGAITVIARDALIAMKTLAGRARDLDDIRRLRELDG